MVGEHGSRNGLPAILKGGGAAISSDFVFWGKNWAWANLSKVFKVVAPYDYLIVGQIRRSILR